MEKHPYNQLCENSPNETKALIIGTAPPPRFSNSACAEDRELDFNFFYGSEDNYMWVFLEEALESRKIFTEEMSSDECCREARELLQRHKLWMCDVLQQYGRNPDRPCSAADNDIVGPVFTDFGSVLDKRPQLTALAFTSQSAASWTLRAFEQQGLIPNSEGCRRTLQQWTQKPTGTRQLLEEKYGTPFGLCNVRGREIRLYILPTPTGRGPRGLTLDVKQEIYRQVLNGF